MRKTSLKSTYFDKLASVNDLLCYFQFADFEAGRNIESLTGNTSGKLASELFLDNEFSPRIQVKYEELLDFRNSANNTAAGMSLSFGIEHLIYYFKDVIALKIELSPSVTLAKINSNAVEDEIETNLKLWGSSNKLSQVIKTVKYLRLRRNHIVHARNGLSDEFERLIRVEGKGLNTFWNRRTNLAGLDFASKDIYNFSVDETYSCMKLLRVCLEEIDEAISSTFSEKELIDYMLKVIIERNPNIAGAVNPISRKVRRCLIDYFGLELDKTVVSKQIESTLESA
ncbi:hypothetical protein [Vibrio parahaemolyticus]|uniref:hypothetical protein n=1 Tax=Vibrio parahaemolyticus TaxID=670 RepID=UPI0023626595|nr:hypothetical protein [Vibrio parahaemolyticus]